ncbi:MAG: serine/threonine-protein kinase [Deltaproteobacteria bacterium]
MVASGDRLGGHLLVESIGARGPTTVWLARSPAGEQVLIDVTPIAPDQVAALGARLEQDLDRARAVQHENVMSVLGAGVEKGCRYLVSAYRAGLLLSELMASGRALGVAFSPGVAGSIARQVAGAVAAVHAALGSDGLPRGARHHELTPAHVFVGESGVVQIAELMWAGDSQDLVTTAGIQSTGTIAYLSPEVASTGRGDGRSDQFAIGVMLYEMLSGRPLFHRTSDVDTLDALRTSDIPALPAGVPSRLAALTMRCLARDPSQRFESVDLLEAALESATVDQPDADPLGVAGHVADVLVAQPRKQKGRTFQLSEASQSGKPAAASDDPPTRVTPPKDGGTDPFFDVERDGDGIDNPRFEVLGRLGSGGMGEVYRVRDHELNEVVALKLIPAHNASELHSIERLKREVRLARRIASEHVCRIFDLVDLGRGSRGLTMALVNGTTLSEMMKLGVQVDYQRFAKWGAHIAHGLGAAHAVDIIHRDLKPENVMIDAEDRAIILDFGIARSQAEATEVDGKLTQAGIIMGTPLYMSPEQLANRELDGRSDLYALGLLLAELITGEVPVPGDGYADILDKRVINASAHDYRLGDVDPGVPDTLAHIIDSLLRPAADDRPADANVVRRALESFVAGVPATSEISAPPAPVVASEPPAPSPPPPSPPKANPNAPWFGMMAVLGVLVLVLGVWVLRPDAQAIDPPLVTPPPVARDAGVLVRDAGVEPPRDAGPKRTTPPPPPPSPEEM